MICWLLGAYYTTRRWIRTGFDSFTVSGHVFMQAEIEMDTRIKGGHPFLVEVQWLVCERCGKRDHYWSPVYAS